MGIIVLSIFLAVIGAVFLILSRYADPGPDTVLKWGAGGMFSALLVLLGIASFTQVAPSHTGIVTTFGSVSTEVLSEGAHLVLPVSKVHEVYGGLNVAAAENAEAGSKDLQKVHSTLTVNYYMQPGKSRDLFIMNPGLNYADAFVVPAAYEVFKAVVAHYTAEELITKREEVSASIMRALGAKLQPFYLNVQSVNLINFGFSQAFDTAIEEKVTASQKAATAERNLEKAKFEAQARVTQAEGEAKAIAIQAAAVEKQGGVGYVQLQAIEKWNGVLPTTMAGGAVPFVNLK
jgi:prohibitin 2